MKRAEWIAPKKSGKGNEIYYSFQQDDLLVDLEKESPIDIIAKVTPFFVLEWFQKKVLTLFCRGKNNGHARVFRRGKIVLCQHFDGKGRNVNQRN